MKIYKVPAAFYRDHIYRDCGNANQIVKTNRSYTYVKLTQETYADLMSDSDYYINAGNEMGSEYKGIIASARATKTALIKQGQPIECMCSYIKNIEAKNQQTYVNCETHN
jgi:hypothetical protein